MIILIYTAVMALLVSAFVFVAALLRTWDTRQSQKRGRKRKYNLKK